MKFKTKSEIRDTSYNHGFTDTNVDLNNAYYLRLKEIAHLINTYASEIIRQLISEFIDNYKETNLITFNVLSKKEITSGLSKDIYKNITINLNKDDYHKLKVIAEENNTYASEIIRQLMADFVEKYEQEHNDEARQ